MPDTLSLTTGVSLGLLAGIVSGVCYLVANGVSWPKEEQTNRRCLKAAKDDGVCTRCGGDQHGGYIPCICRDYQPVKFESGAWFLRQVQRAVTLMPWSLSTDKLEQIDEEYDGRESPGPSRAAQNDATVREFLETLAAKLTGGTIEGTRVSPLYDHPAYERMLEQYHAPLQLALSTLGTALRDALTRKALHALCGGLLLYHNLSQNTSVVGLWAWHERCRRKYFDGLDYFGVRVR